MPFELGIIRNHYVGRTFIEPEQRIRQLGVKLKHSANAAAVRGNRIVLIDDSVVRGTTSKKIVQMMFEAGAREVHFRLCSPPITGPCHYGIDTPTREELIGATHSTEEIREYLGVDSLGYLSLEGMLRAAGQDPDEPGHFCHACFSGEYPTPVHEDLVQLRHMTPLLATGV